MASTEGSQGAPAEAEAPPATAAAQETLPELPLFSCKEAYVYRAPPATTVGHRAELWDVNNWLATVSLRVVQADDEAYVRLLDEKTGDLFAECPVPTDKPLTTAVEPVIDSSRYFVLRIVDRDSQRHAFIGIGFRDRNEASDFNAALHEFLQYLKRKRTAEAMRHAYEERMQSAADGARSQGDAGTAPLADYSIKEGETLTLRIAAAKPSLGGFVSRGAVRGPLAKTFSLIMDGHGGSVAALSPPPPRGSSPRLDMSVSPSLEAGGGSPMASEGSGSVGGSPGRRPAVRLSGGEEGELQQRLRGLHLQQGVESQPISCSVSVASTSTAVAAADDEFGDFEEADEGEEAELQQAPASEQGVTS